MQTKNIPCKKELTRNDKSPGIVVDDEFLLRFVKADHVSQDRHKLTPAFISNSHLKKHGLSHYRQLHTSKEELDILVTSYQSIVKYPVFGTAKIQCKQARNLKHDHQRSVCVIDSPTASSKAHADILLSEDLSDAPDEVLLKIRRQLLDLYEILEPAS